MNMNRYYRCMFILLCLSAAGCMESSSSCSGEIEVVVDGPDCEFHVGTSKVRLNLRRDDANDRVFALGVHISSDIPSVIVASVNIEGSGGNYKQAASMGIFESEGYYGNEVVFGFLAGERMDDTHAIVSVFGDVRSIKLSVH